MSEIPTEVFREILLRVPAEPLLRFRVVCKAWCRIIDDKSFAETHHRYEHSPTTLLIRNDVGSRFYSVSLDSLILCDGSQLITATPVKPLVRRGVPRVPDFPVASCNGLILIFEQFDTKKTWVIWNWLTREFHELPKPDSHLNLICNGFGYDSAADDYKVVRIDLVNNNSKTLISSLKLDSWKMIKDFPGDLRCSGEVGVFLNGALYWRSKKTIIVLDLGTEDYSYLPFPPYASRRGKPSQVHLDAMGGCLMLSYCYKERMHIWVMEDCRVEKLWTKLFSSKKRRFQSHDCFSKLVTLKPLAYLKSNGQVLLQHKKRFFWLDTKKKSMRKVRIEGLQGNFFDFSCQISTGSLFQLTQSYEVKRRVSTKRTRTKRKEPKERKRLKIYVKNTSDLWHTSDSEFDCLSDSSWLSLDPECVSDSMDP